jgi:hypothetical protein
MNVSEEYAGLSDAQLQALQVPKPDLLGISLRPDSARKEAARRIKAGAVVVPAEAHSENFAFNPRTSKFWEDQTVQRAALHSELLATLQRHCPEVTVGQLATLLQGWQENQEVLQAVAALSNPADGSPSLFTPISQTTASTQAAVGEPQTGNASAQEELFVAPTPAISTTASATPLAPPQSTDSFTTPAPAAAASTTGVDTAALTVSRDTAKVYGHFALSGNANSMFVLPDPSGGQLFVPSIEPLCTLALEERPLPASTHGILAAARIDSVRSWANFQQPPPLSLDALRELIELRVYAKSRDA